MNIKARHAQTSSSGFYEDTEVNNLLDTYRVLFPDPNMSACEYLGIHRPNERPWALLCTDFRSATLPQFRDLDAAIASLPHSDSGEHTAEQLRLLVAEHRIGTSIGINPWMDWLLYENIRDGRMSRFVAVIAHDWYPVVEEDRKKGAHVFHVNSPLFQERTEFELKYESAFQPLRAAGVGILFMNLVPDLRPPYNEKLGRIPKTDYLKCREGLLSLLSGFAARNELIAVVSWGEDVWKQLRTISQPTPNKFGDAVLASCHARASKLRLGNADPAYFPFYHPSHAPFHKDLGHGVKHSERYMEVLQKL